MSEDLTKRLPLDANDKLNLILTTVQNLERHSITAETQFSSVEERLKRLEFGFNNINSRLQRVEQKVEQRLYDTRPMWHRVVDYMGELQKSQQRLEQGQGVLNDAILKITSDIHAIDVRLSRLEGNRNQRNSST